MCKEGVEILFCTLGQHEVGEPVVKRQYRCHASESVGFGQCGKVTRGKPGHFFTRCDSCVADRRAERAMSRAASRAASRLATRANTPTTARADTPTKKVDAPVTEEGNLPGSGDDDAQNTY